jgi:putative NADH-flavin reductase
VKLLVVGATGGVGRHLLAQGLAAGHDVRALVRDPSRLPAGVPAVAADLAEPDPAALDAAVAEADAVLSALGPRTRADAGVVTTGTEAVVAAMRRAAVGRLVVVSAAPVATVASPARPRPGRDPGDGPLMRAILTPLVRRVFRDSYADLARMEDAVHASGLDWTVVRPPRLVDGPRTGGYRTGLDRNVRGGLRIARADVAHLMLAALDRPDTIGHTLGIAY